MSFRPAPDGSSIFDVLRIERAIHQTKYDVNLYGASSGVFHRAVYSPQGFLKSAHADIGELGYGVVDGFA